MLLGVDVGGTFTDAVLHDGSRLHTAKVPTDVTDQSRSVMASVAEVLSRAGVEAADVETFAHGMTVGTNALLTESGARTALVTTRGFADVIEIGRQDRPELYRLCAPKPVPLVDESLRFEVDERTGPEGIIEPFDPDQLEPLVTAISECGAEAVAVCLLFSYLDPEHESAIAAHLREALPGVHVSASHEVLPQFREYERFSTTVIDAYLSPLLAAYLGRVAAAAEDGGLSEPLVMQSSGGVAPISAAARAGAWSVLSGPAGGAVGAKLLSRISADGDALGFDMGGTSCDVCVVEGGEVRQTDSREIGGRVIQLPMVDVHTVGAGGGSIGWRDEGGALRTGPQSAGSDPGPACYGRGGEQPTVTDADLLLGYLAPGSELAGGIELDRAAAESAVEKLADDLGLGVIETAEGIVRVANAEMTRALRVVTVERGVDPRGFALMPFGGAGPMHAAAVAEEMGIRRILCPRACGVLSALGLCASELRRDTVRTVLLNLDETDGGQIAGEVSALVATLYADPEPGPDPDADADADADDAASDRTADVRVTYEMRYGGQAFELSVPGPPQPDPAELAEAFTAAHQERYGFSDTDARIELVNIRLALVFASPDPGIAAAGGDEVEQFTREARFGGAWLETSVLAGEPGAGTTVDGPAIVQLPEATLVLPPSWSAKIDDAGTICAEWDATKQAGG